MKLYVYDHCPYCVRARMIFGLKQLPFDLEILLNDDEKTPISMVGKKMLPILQKQDGSFMPESLDIVNYIDNYQTPSVLIGKVSLAMAELIQQLDNPAFRKLCAPRHVRLNLPEFATLSAQHYFIDKKQQVLGDFQQCIIDTPTLLETIMPIIDKIELAIKSDSACNGVLSLDDICLFPLLRNLTVIKALTFPPKIRAYLEKMSALAHVPLYFEQAI